MTVFCEAGRIAVPPTHAILFGELEQIVAEVRPPEGRSFHPKVWVLRFEHEDKPVRYRLLCMTRNLTFDRSWDTMLALDGELHDRQLAIAVNHPLADFIQALPGMAKPGSVSDRAHAQVATAADELRRVKFEPPEGFDDFAFHPLGLEPRRHPWPLERADRLLIMSPFLSDGLVDEIAAQAAESILISRPDTLDSISRSVFNNTRTVYSLSPDSTPVEPAGVETAHPDGITASGLHAKLYVAEIGWDARVLTGSANATHAAWYGNIEFLTELIGKRSKCGIDVLLDGEDGGSSLRDFLVEYPVDAPGVDGGTDAAPWDDMLDAAQRILGAASWEATISPTDAGTFNIALASDVVGTPLERLALAACPVLLPSSSAQPLATESGRYVAAFDGITFEGLTSFFALEVRPIDAPVAESRSFVVNARLIGEPADPARAGPRLSFATAISVVRFLLMLLADVPEEIGSSTEATPSCWMGSHGAAAERTASRCSNPFFARSTGTPSLSIKLHR